MGILSITKNSKMNSLLKKIKSSDKSKRLRISDLDKDSVVLTVDQIGITPYGEGVAILKTQEGIKFPIFSFSADTAKLISNFKEGHLDVIPSMYNMLENICENLGVILVKVRIYENGKALRANLYFSGKKDVILRNYKASDALALAVLYSVPILVKKDLLKQSLKIDSKNAKTT